MPFQEKAVSWSGLTQAIRQILDDEKIRTYAQRPLGALLGAFPALLLVMWVFGVNTKESARIATVIAIILFLLVRRYPTEKEVSSRTYKVFRIFPFVFVSLVGIYQLVRVYLGAHGIDFAIFTQVIRSIRDTGIPTTSLVAPGPVNFFSHHFAPFFYLLGWCSRISLEPYEIGILAQSLSVGFGVFFFFKFCRALGFSAATAGVGATLLCINPCFRSGISWGIHDEVFAVGLIGAAFYCWLTNRIVSCSLCLLLLGVFKETFFLGAAIAGAMACVAAFRVNKMTARACWAYGAVAAVMSLAAFFYFVLIPLYPEVFQMSFRPASRLAPISSLLSWSFISSKVVFLLYLLVPLFGLPLLSRSGFLLWICAAPFWGACLVSNFAEMHKAFNYYAVVPTYVGFFASAMTVKRLWGSDFLFTRVSLFVATCLAFSSGYAASPFKPIKALLTGSPILPDSLTMIPRHLAVVASEFDSVFILDKRSVVRLWIAERVPTSWDVALVRDNTREPPSKKILKGTSLCYQDSLWKVYCRKGVTLAAPKP
jgi:uncharacterized membrane protein